MARGIETTIEELNRRNIAHTGAFADSTDYAQNNVQHFERRGVRFALVNYTYGTNGIPVPKGKMVNLIDTNIIKRDLRTISRDSVDCVIACMHWGVEYQRSANSEQKRLAAMLRREGVDIIIGSHPHVVQPYEADSTHVVYYSLGNLVSNQQWRYSDGGLLAEIEVIRCDTIDGLRFNTTTHPVWVLCPGYRVLPRSVGDTIKMSATSREQYNCFMSDTDKLLSR
jgi:poly-gamma-glutamate synthesis protein (capsule biosynthesis protein)